MQSAAHGILARKACCAVLQMIKDQMDKKFGSPWHVIVGKAFAYEITYEVSGKGAGTHDSECNLCSMHACISQLSAAPAPCAQQHQERKCNCTTKELLQQSRKAAGM